MSKVEKIFVLARTVPRLGLDNVAYVAEYRARLLFGWRPEPIARPCPAGPFFGQTEEVDTPSLIEETLFGWKSISLEGPPDWHTNPFDPTVRNDLTKDWHASLAKLQGADPKHFWELSRFYWAPRFALAARNGDEKALARLNAWLADWVAANPPHKGINWSCGQEASIRVMNLALAAIILEDWQKPNPALAWFIEAHTKRIAPTLHYAVGQDNNHGSAEACALFIAGSWGRYWDMVGAAKLEKRGRKWLSNRALRLIQQDGSPSQYSVTYHRANLETFSFAQLWATRLGLTTMPQKARSRVVQAAHWLHQLIDPNTGDAPNIGANDGSHLFNIHNSDYRDFRPSVSLTARLFDRSEAFPGYTDPRTVTLQIPPALGPAWPAARSVIHKNGGFHVLRSNKAMAVLRYPNFRFRPSQADMLHVDLWADGVNLLRDAGTFSYVANDYAWYCSVAAHNTIAFDDHDQMPRLGKFLFGDWLKTSLVMPVEERKQQLMAGAAYKDRFGNHHFRELSLGAADLVCTDTISGPFETAVLRWRLAPGNWIQTSAGVSNGSVTLRIDVDGKPMKPMLSTTFESRYYQKQTELPLACLTLKRPTTIITKVSF